MLPPAPQADWMTAAHARKRREVSFGSITEWLRLVLSRHILWERTMIKEHDRVVLTVPLPSEGLEAGDVGTVVHIHKDGQAYEVEFLTLDGNTAAVATVEASQLRPVGDRDITHTREFSIA